MKSNNQRILQLIDSLDAGGAERMAVNYANTLAEIIPYSALITTRREGTLKLQLSPKVDYMFLNRKGKVGVKAILKLRKFIKQNKVDIIHAHSTSFFTATLVKLIYPKVRIVWHDHYGNSEFLAKRNSLPLKFCSYLFEGIISVNFKLSNWAQKTLNCSKVIYLPNFVNLQNNSNPETFLQGEQGKRIICLANLREQKNHSMLIEIADTIAKNKPDWTFHLVGKDFQDNYSYNLRQLIKAKNLENHVFVYGSKNDIGNILQQCEIAILTSKSEGLPVALLEYGFYKKPVITTNVGEIGSVINNNENGILIESEDVKSFTEALLYLMENKALKEKLGYNLNKTILNNYSDISVIKNYLNWLYQK